MSDHTYYAFRNVGQEDVCYDAISYDLQELLWHFWKNNVTDDEIERMDEESIPHNYFEFWERDLGNRPEIVTVRITVIGGVDIGTIRKAFPCRY